MAEESKLQNNDSTESQETRRRVGDVLRSARLARDMDMQEVADKLCIRRAFLEAIENSRPQDLPGTTYALGFVRTYAEHLNLEAKPLVDQFKAEAAELEQQTHLHFPEPLPAKSLPGGALVFIGLVLLAIFYGIWWYLNNEGKSFVDLIPGVPDQFAELVEEGEAEPMPEGATTINTTQTSATSAPAATTEEPPVEPVVQEATDAASATVESVAEESVATAEEAATATEEAATEIVEEVTETATAAVEATETAVEEAVSATVETNESPVEAETPAAETETPASTESVQEAAVENTSEATTEPETPEPATAAAAPQPQPGTNNKVFGEENANARVVITARSTAWVEITGPTGERLLTRLMNQGDQYRVPNINGVTLVTGNAGALEISVDGQPGKPLGPSGAVRRDVSLDPDALAAAQ